MLDLIFDTLEETATEVPKSTLIATVAIVGILAIANMDE